MIQMIEITIGVFLVLGLAIWYFARSVFLEECEHKKSGVGGYDRPTPCPPPPGRPPVSMTPEDYNKMIANKILDYFKSDPFFLLPSRQDKTCKSLVIAGYEQFLPIHYLDEFKVGKWIGFGSYEFASCHLSEKKLLRVSDLEIRVVNPYQDFRIVLKAYLKIDSNDNISIRLEDGTLFEVWWKEHMNTGPVEVGSQWVI